MPAGLVEQDAPAAWTNDHRHLTAGGRYSIQLGQGPLGRPAGQVSHVDSIEQLETHCVAHRFAAGLEARVAAGHAGHREQGPDLTVPGKQAIAVGDLDPSLTVGVAGRDLCDGTVPGSGCLVGLG